MENQITKPKHAKRGKRSTRTASPAARAAGKANLLRFRAENSAPALSHGIGSVIASGGEIPDGIPDGAEVRELVSGLIDAAIGDLGGKSEVTSTQRQILESSRLALTILVLGARYLGTHGIVDRRGKPQGLLSVLGVYANIVRLNAVELGLSRKTKDAMTLEATLERIAEKESQKESNEAHTQKN